MYVLGIETTCDETSCAIVKDGKEILSNVISSQIDLHAEYGGVVPELSCRRHVDVLIPVLQQCLEEANLSLDEIDLIAVAKGPGLIGALLLGTTAAKTLSLALNKPLIGINHVEAHLYAACMSCNDPIKFPSIGVVLSGGHTALVKMHDIGHYEIIGETVDDAMGEAFDKVAKLMDLPYPGGPQIEALALKGDAYRFPFKAGKVKKNLLQFSFSGLKTAVLYAIRALEQPITDKDRADIAASFQRTSVEDVVNKLETAIQHNECHSLIFGGGVTNNKYLRQQIGLKFPEIKVLWPSVGLSLDNAAMIAGLGYHHYCNQKQLDGLDLEPMTRIPF